MDLNPPAAAERVQPAEARREVEVSIEFPDGGDDDDSLADDQDAFEIAPARPKRKTPGPNKNKGRCRNCWRDPNWVDYQHLHMLPLSTIEDRGSVPVDHTSTRMEDFPVPDGMGIRNRYRKI